MDVRKLKTALRKKHKAIRRNFTQEQKQNKDNQIMDKVIKSEDYKNAEMVVAFISTEIEVNTHKLIQQAWQDSKKVAVPRCINSNGAMKFFYIKSFDDLEVGSFSILEPKADFCEEVTCFDNSICMVPALAFDKNGYRLGYGKGYYDRFLSRYNGVKIGVNYSDCMEFMLPFGKYDVTVDYIITDEKIEK